MPLDSRPDVTTPNGVEELQVFALHVNPRSEVESNCHVDNLHLCRSLNLRPDQHSSKNPPRIITSLERTMKCEPLSSSRPAVKNAAWDSVEYPWDSN